MGHDGTRRYMICSDHQENGFVTCAQWAPGGRQLLLATVLQCALLVVHIDEDEMNHVASTVNHWYPFLRTVPKSSQIEGQVTEHSSNIAGVFWASGILQRQSGGLWSSKWSLRSRICWTHGLRAFHEVDLTMPTAASRGVSYWWSERHAIQKSALYRSDCEH